MPNITSQPLTRAKPQPSHRHGRSPNSSVRSDGGFTVLEVVLLVPMLMLIVGVIVLAGVVQGAENAVEDAAAQGARAASLQRTAAAARSEGERIARAALTEQSLSCAVEIDPGNAFAQSSVGQFSEVRATVTCPLNLAQRVGLGGTKTVTATASSPVDRYRGRG